MYLTLFDDEREFRLPDSYMLVVGGSPLGMEAPSLRKLADSAQLVIAADSGANQLARANGRIDILVGDLDSISSRGRAFAKQSNARTLAVSANKGFTDIQLALKTAREEGAESVVLANVTGGRLDHTLGVIGAMTDARDLKPAAIDSREIICVLAAHDGARKSVVLEDLGCKAGDEFSVLACEGGSRVSETGVVWPLDHHELALLDGLGISNVVESADAMVECHDGVVLVVVSSYVSTRCLHEL